MYVYCIYTSPSQLPGFDFILKIKCLSIVNILHLKKPTLFALYVIIICEVTCSYKRFVVLCRTRKRLF